MSDVSPDNCEPGATREPAHRRGAKSKSGFPTIQTSSCAQHPSNALKLPGTTVCLPSDNVVQIRDGQCLSNKKTQPTAP
jgi:isopentenyldiphosphate isomerase